MIKTISELKDYLLEHRLGVTMFGCTVAVTIGSLSVDSAKYIVPLAACFAVRAAVPERFFSVLKRLLRNPAVAIKN
ncbi:MAG: hypothetical protein ABSH12_08510 [Endomicrobiales bacterium]